MFEDSRVKVLVVDDDPAAVRLLERHLRNAGHEVLTAENGVQAMQILFTEGPPVVIADWMMPEMDGLELCRAIREHEAIPFAYVVIVTAHQTSDDQLVEAFNAGADDYLCKPVNVKELLARLRAGERIFQLQRALDDRHREAHRYNAQMEIINGKLEHANEELNRMATTDELTGLFNRREALDRLSQLWMTSERHEQPMSIISLDLDRFKSFNDGYGHAVGDSVLKETSRVLRDAARRDDSVCRVGGEEFLILCSHTTESEAAVGAERFRSVVEENAVEHDDLILRVTISLGVAERTSTMGSFDDLLRAADDALYAAKDAGRNVVKLAGALADVPDAVPLIPSDATEAVDGGEPNSKEDHAGRVLVADDDESARVFCRRFLERNGYDVLEAVDGLDVMEKAQRLAPDVIVMDAVMPHLHGLECTRRIKADPATCSIPIIVASARSDATDIVASLEAGADEFLSKPFNPRELILRVKTMARLSRELTLSNDVRGEQSRALGLLLELTHDIAAADTLNDVLEHTINAAAALTCSPKVSILLPDPHGRVLHVASHLGIDSDAVDAICVPLGAPTSGEVYASRNSVVLGTADEVAEHAGAVDGVLLSGVPCASIALRAPECVVGVLNLSGRQSQRPFRDVELEYLDLIGNIAAAAIHERVTRRARDEARHSVVIALARLAEHRDSDTGQHVERVTQFCDLLARRLRRRKRYDAVITESFLQDLQRAAPLHDIGKVAVPDHILHKPGSLTPEETAVMQSHASVGAKTLHSVVERMPDTTFLAMAEDIASSHHEWFNGEGYPQRLRADQIPLAARIATLADVYDAITTKRCYKPAMTHRQACDIISASAGRQFDPDVVDAFHQCASEFESLASDLADETPSVSFPSRADASPPEEILCIE